MRRKDAFGNYVLKLAQSPEEIDLIFKAYSLLRQNPPKDHSDEWAPQVTDGRKQVYMETYLVGTALLAYIVSEVERLKAQGVPQKITETVQVFGHDCTFQSPCFEGRTIDEDPEKDRLVRLIQARADNGLKFLNFNDEVIKNSGSATGRLSKEEILKKIPGDLRFILEQMWKE